MPLSASFATMTNKRKFDDVSEGAFHTSFNPQWHSEEDDSMAISPPPTQKMRFTGQHSDDAERSTFGKKCKMNGDFWDSARSQDVANELPLMDASIATPPYHDAASVAQSREEAQLDQTASMRSSMPTLQTTAASSLDSRSAHEAVTAARDAIAWQQRRADPKKASAILASGYSRSQSPSVQPGSLGGQFVTRHEFDIVQGQVSVLKDTCLSLIQEISELRAQMANAANNQGSAHNDMTGLSNNGNGIRRPSQPIYFAPHQHIPAP